MKELILFFPYRCPHNRCVSSCVCPYLTPTFPRSHIYREQFIYSDDNSTRGISYKVYTAVEFESARERKSLYMNYISKTRLNDDDDDDIQLMFTW